jgi:hypothetical protein
MTWLNKTQPWGAKWGFAETRADEPRGMSTGGIGIVPDTEFGDDSRRRQNMATMS